MRIADSLFGGLMGILGLLCLFEIHKVWTGWDGPGLMLLIMGSICIIISVLFIGFPGEGRVEWYSKGEVFRIGVVSVSFALYIAVLEWIGYPLATWSLLTVVTKFTSHRRIWGIMIWTGAVGVGTYVLFKKYLALPLPEGFIGGFIGF
ncbi:MAG: tripartite tricarboxylate transporter TctB family protein, partial [Candidatus Zixiibacteriota bacterium]